MTRREQADAREKATGMRQSVGAMTAKIAFGALFLISGFTTNWSERSDVADPLASMLLSIVLGLALIAWGLIPRLKADRRKAAAAKAKAAELEAQRLRSENEVKVCPACGATTRGLSCEYCGTPLK